MIKRKAKEKWEFGDFQTPGPLARTAFEALQRIGINPAAVIEPTCGEGAFLLAAIEAFPNARRFAGVDINLRYLNSLKSQISALSRKHDIDLVHGDFFHLNWDVILNQLPQPILIVGNPPWVTSSELAQLQSQNLPHKSNFQQRRGYDAITGKSNFDISEWMLLRNLEWLKERQGTIAVLCKTTVARKMLFHAWKHHFPVANASMFLIDAQQHFGASVDACFLVVNLFPGKHSNDCAVYGELASTKPSQTIGYQDDSLVANVSNYARWRHLKGDSDFYIWRSGIKHDCSRLMELELEGGKYRNGAGERLDIEENFVYPMLKSSDISNGQVRYGRKHMLVTQRYVGEDTNPIRLVAPRTWRYLETHKEIFAARASAIYRKRPPYSIFGIGDYSFSPWKVAISGFYKRLAFQMVERFRGKPVVLDDTTYFLPCWSKAEASFMAGLLNSEPAIAFFDSMIFWSDKRPITIDVLKRLDLYALSVELGCESRYQAFARRRKDYEKEHIHGQLSLGIEQPTKTYAVNRRAIKRNIRRTRERNVRN